MTIKELIAKYAPQEWSVAERPQHTTPKPVGKRSVEQSGGSKGGKSASEDIERILMMQKLIMY